VFRPGDIFIYLIITVLTVLPFLPEDHDTSADSKIKITAGDNTFFVETGKDSLYTIKEGKDSVVVEVKNGMVRIKSSTCRDKYCEKKGWLKETDGGDIICMPNRVIVSFAGEEKSEIDAVTE